MFKHILCAVALSFSSFCFAQESRIDNINNDLMLKSPTARALVLTAANSNRVYIVKEARIPDRRVLGQCVVLSTGEIEIKIDVFNCIKASVDPRIVLAHEYQHLCEAVQDRDWAKHARAHAFSLTYLNRPEELAAFKAQAQARAEIESYEAAHRS